MKSKKEKEQKKQNRLDEKRILKQIEASFCDIGVFDIIETHILSEKKQASKQA